jgi:hypothetical protein
MKKLALNVNDLRVESFDLTDTQVERGTVNGHMSDGVCTGLIECSRIRTCNFTCEHTCETHVCIC